ncbi:alkaline phosphatase [Bacillus seohaeanensis]|uniref:Alkaline phosphatase n=1 Tax=Bacillus seohaeanensis TaxID=284580 RepID=A0ABW5RX48_9BACI
MNLLKKSALIILFISVFLIALPSNCFSLQASATGTKNVILLIMDGTNSDVVTLSRWYKGSSLNLDSIVVGGVRTYSAQSAITDSAAAGTAMATGHKTLADYIGMIPISGRKDTRPVLTVLEAAHLHGYSTGLVSTSPIQHATPAAFSSHVNDRNDFSDIGEQQVYQNLDVALGGGKAWLHPKAEDNVKNDDGMLKTREVSRTDGENLLKEVKTNGYTLLKTREELLKKDVRNDKVWGLFANEDISYEFDRETLHPDQPSLAEMTKKAIESLSSSKNGFFLMVEGSKIDWAAHKNDPIGMISEVLSFDDAVGEALDFAKKDKNTMIIAVTDHGNSGLTIGNSSTNKDYFNQPAGNFIKPLKKAELTVKGATSQLKKDRSNLKKVLTTYGLDDLSKAEYCKIKEADDLETIEDSMVKMMAKRAHLGFTTHGHSGEDIFLYAYGPGKPTGLIENTHIPLIISEYLGIPLHSKRYDEWYINAMTYFKKKGYKVKIDKQDKDNPIFTAIKGSEKLQFPENKNYYLRNGNKVLLESVNVYSGDGFYVHVDF